MANRLTQSKKAVFENKKKITLHPRQWFSHLQFASQFGPDDIPDSLATQPGIKILNSRWDIHWELEGLGVVVEPLKIHDCDRTIVEISPSVWAFSKRMGTQLMMPSDPLYFKECLGDKDNRWVFWKVLAPRVTHPLADTVEIPKHHLKTCFGDSCSAIAQAYESSHVTAFPLVLVSQEPEDEPGYYSYLYWTLGNQIKKNVHYFKAL